MGTISYDGMRVKIDDRTLAHLQIVIVNKLRRGDTFLMSWKDSVEAGSGRSAIWLHPYVLVHFKFDGSRVPSINPQWLAQLTESADSSKGLIVTAEHGGFAELVRTLKTDTDTCLEPTEDEAFHAARKPASTSPPSTRRS